MNPAAIEGYLTLIQVSGIIIAAGLWPDMAGNNLPDYF